MFRNSSTIAFLREDSGAGTSWWVIWMIIFMVFGGVAIDSANAWRMRAQLQFTADAAAHAGVIDLPNQTQAKAAAQTFASSNMSEADHGDVLAAADVEVGMWDETTESFIALPLSPPIVDAVRVVTRRNESNANRLKTSFLQLVGLDAWDISTRAVAQRYFPRCNNTDAIIAGQIVDLQSNNLFRSGMCIHGNDHVQVNNGNTWEQGVSVTMPNLADLVTPSSDIDEQNTGLVNALGEEWFLPKIVQQLPTIFTALLDPNGPYTPSYIGKDLLGIPIPLGQIVKNVAHTAFNSGALLPGHIYNVTCANPGGAPLNLGASSVITKVVIVTNCRVNTGQGTYFHDAILASTALDKVSGTDPKSINIGQSNQFGANDNCAPGGGVHVFAKHTIHGAAQITAYGAQFVAGADITLAAQAQGLQGIIIQAGKDASITSNNAFGGGCPDIGAIQVPYFRLVL